MQRDGLQYLNPEPSLLSLSPSHPQGPQLSNEYFTATAASISPDPPLASAVTKSHFAPGNVCGFVETEHATVAHGALSLKACFVSLFECFRPSFDSHTFSVTSSVAALSGEPPTSAVNVNVSVGDTAPLFPPTVPFAFAATPGEVFGVRVALTGGQNTPPWGGNPEGFFSALMSGAEKTHFDSSPALMVRLDLAKEEREKRKRERKQHELTNESTTLVIFEKRRTTGVYAPQVVARLEVRSFGSVDKHINPQHLRPALVIIVEAMGVVHPERPFLL